MCGKIGKSILVMESKTIRRVLWRILLLSSLINGKVCGLSKCAYTYTVQPPEDLVCNPYVNKVVQLECAIRGSNLAQIQWYFLPSSNINMSDTIEITDGSKYTVTMISSDNLLTSRLTVRNLTEEKDFGMYWCRGSLDDGTMLQTISDSLKLRYMEEYPPTECTVNLFLKRTMMKCIIFPVPTDQHGNGTISDATIDRKVTDFGEFVTTTASITDSITPQPPSLFNNVMIVIITLVTFFLIVCVILSVVIGTQCRRRLKANGYHESTGQHCLRTSSEGTDSHIERKASSGEYAEIGPAIMASMNHHLADNPHYSHIIKQSQPPLCSSYAPFIDPAEGCHIVENPYDAPISPKNAERPLTESELDKCYSRLERVAPIALVQPSTDICCLDRVSCYIKPTINPEQNEFFDVETQQSLEEELDTTNKHPYHILEGPKDEEQLTERWSFYSGTDVPKEVGSDSDGPLECSSTSGTCRQISGNFKIYDVSKSPYDHLESQDKIAVKYRNSEQFREPITLQKSSQYAYGIATNYSEDMIKYSGDYERDPIYMERLHQGDAKMSPFHYQSLVRAMMTPAEDYTNLQVL